MPRPSSSLRVEIFVVEHILPSVQHSASVLISIINSSLTMFQIFSLQSCKTVKRIRHIVFRRHFPSFLVNRNNKLPVLRNHSTIVGCLKYYTERLARLTEKLLSIFPRISYGLSIFSPLFEVIASFLVKVVIMSVPPEMDSRYSGFFFSRDEPRIRIIFCVFCSNIRNIAHNRLLSVYLCTSL